MFLPKSKDEWRERDWQIYLCGLALGLITFAMLSAPW